MFGTAQRPRGFVRALALSVAVLFVGGIVLAMHHQADVAHVRDASGASTHGLETDCHDGTPVTHLHEVPHEHGGEACALGDALHPVVRLPELLAIATPVAAADVVASAPRIALVTFDVLLTAPKTSPPSHA
jgi:hypothetical protein